MAQDGSATDSSRISRRDTRILPVDVSKICSLNFSDDQEPFLGDWTMDLRDNITDTTNLRTAADRMRTSDIPVAFPTETVYGLGADATRSSAVRGIYEAKQRPADNPLIVHICSLEQLRGLLQPSRIKTRYKPSQPTELERKFGAKWDIERYPPDPIPKIYRPLIRRFWPGPLTILLPNPTDSVLAPEVTAGLPTFGARMPKSLLALALIKIAGVPLAAPSANASTKPSPTTAEHVKHDLDGRIDLILDGGPCDVGVESTVVDGLSDPPVILRPGGVSIEQLRECCGWQNVVIGYKDGSENGTAPKAPGMKYKHYSPKATVVLYDAGSGQPSTDVVKRYLGENRSIGIVRTKTWERGFGLKVVEVSNSDQNAAITNGDHEHPIQDNLSQPKLADCPINGTTPAPSNLPKSNTTHTTTAAHAISITLDSADKPIQLWDIALGNKVETIARGLFSALRELDSKNVDVIFVEGISDSEGDTAAAVMNRLRKAAEVHVTL
ncbi:MAG: hypothetical protein M1830_005939 [Pleopsidium flavum]|nr:MAG: hypothetical protein M1830_005939 [Pleopsidium flavum]